MACPKLNFLKGNTDTLYFNFISFQIYVNMPLAAEQQKCKKKYHLHLYKNVKKNIIYIYIHMYIYVDDIFFYIFVVQQPVEYAKTTFQFINITIEDTREQKYLIGHQYSNINDGSKNSCDKHRNHVLPNLCGAGGHQTGIDI